VVQIQQHDQRPQPQPPVRCRPLPYRNKLRSCQSVRRDVMLCNMMPRKPARSHSLRSAGDRHSAAQVDACFVQMIEPAKLIDGWRSVFHQLLRDRKISWPRPGTAVLPARLGNRFGRNLPTCRLRAFGVRRIRFLRNLPIDGCHTRSAEARAANGGRRARPGITRTANSMKAPSTSQSLVRVIGGRAPACRGVLDGVGVAVSTHDAELAHRLARRAATRAWCGCRPRSPRCGMSAFVG